MKQQMQKKFHDTFTLSPDDQVETFKNLRFQSIYINIKNLSTTILRKSSYTDFLPVNNTN